MKLVKEFIELHQEKFAKWCSDRGIDHNYWHDYEPDFIDSMRNEFKKFIEDKQEEANGDYSRRPENRKDH